MANKQLPIATLSFAALIASTGITEASKRTSDIPLLEKTHTIRVLKKPASHDTEPAATQPSLPPIVGSSIPAQVPTQPAATSPSNPEPGISSVGPQTSLSEAESTVLTAIPTAENPPTPQQPKIAPLPDIALVVNRSPAATPGRRSTQNTPPPIMVTSTTQKPVISPL